MHKTAEEHIALAESILEQVEDSIYYEATHEKALECAKLHIKLAETILHMRTQDKPEKPKNGIVRGIA